MAAQIGVQTARPVQVYIPDNGREPAPKAASAIPIAAGHAIAPSGDALESA
jgi:hypothetical protein